MQLSLWNTRTRSRTGLSPIDGDTVKMYCCGPTVYNFAHIGNLRTYIFEDILNRAIRLSGTKLLHVMNITDVGHLIGDADDGEDRMLKASREKAMSPWDIAAFYTKAFFEDCAKLRITRPQVIAKATDHIPEMIQLIQRLEAGGFTYIAEGNVIFSIDAFPRYGELGGLKLDELKAGARIVVDSSKKNPHDFVLWFTKSKFENQIMVWDSPWGRGYPGWHIECSAMSCKYLGEQFDIHCGGVDHIGVHHSNEIAQTEAATGKHPWVNIWLHAEHLKLNAEKMSKSTGEFLTLSRLESQGFSPLDYRFFCLGAHYKTQLSYTNEAMLAAQQGRNNLLERIVSLIKSAGSEGEKRVRVARSRSAQESADGFSAKVPTAAEVDAALGAEAKPLWEDFVRHVSEDLNMPRALAVLWDVTKSGAVSSASKLDLVDAMDSVLGLDLLAEAAKRIEDESKTDPEAQEIEALIVERNEARKGKNFARSDEIRNALNARGIVLLDGPQGTQWRREKPAAGKSV